MIYLITKKHNQIINISFKAEKYDDFPTWTSIPKHIEYDEEKKTISYNSSTVEQPSCKW